MCDAFSLPTIFTIEFVSDFCKSKIQQIPFNSQYAKLANNQIQTYLEEVDISAVSQIFDSHIKEAQANIERVINREEIPFNDLVTIYQNLRILVILLLIHYHYFEVKTQDLYDRLAVCLKYITSDNFSKGIDMGEVLLAHSV